MDLAEDYEYFNLRPPFLTCVLGSTNTGKTTLVARILENWENVTTSPPPPIWQVIIVFEHHQPLYDRIINAVRSKYPGVKERWMWGWDESAMSDSNLFQNSEGGQTVLIIDDSLHKLNKSNAFVNICRGGSHHSNISVFLIAQDLTAIGNELRGAIRNMKYVIITQPASHTINYLKRNLFPQSNLNYVQAFEFAKQHAQNPDYPYLVLSNVSGCPVDRSVFTGMLDGEEGFVFAPAD